MNNQYSIENVHNNDIDAKYKIELTIEQKKINNELIKFVKSKSEKEILLVGYAGTGKTTLMAKFINDLVENKICKRIVMAAPTHKAVNIAKSKLFPDSEKDYGELNKIINIMTIHRLLNYQSYIGSEGEKFFAKGKVEPNWSIYNLIVVDECSMLSNQIINDIKELNSKETNIGLKIIYMGDPAQLPPVNQKESKIFSSNIKTLTLSKIIRTSNNNIMELSNSHRKWIFSKKDDDIPHIAKFESTDIKLFSFQNKETKKWLDSYVELLKFSNNKIEPNTGLTPTSTSLQIDLINNDIKMIDNHNNNIILTWTNKKSNIYNQYIREKIFNKKNLAKWEIGEILIFNDFHRKNINNPNNPNILDDLIKQDKVETVSFYTSEQVKLIKINKIKYKFKQLKFKLCTDLTPELNNKFKKYYKKINKLIYDEQFDVHEMTVQKIIDLMNDKNTLIPEYNILSLYSSEEMVYNKIIEEIEKNILVLKSTCYELINNLSIDNMKKCDLQHGVEKKINKLFKEYQTNIIDCFAKLNYGYCITVHKAQGSTFKCVFSDINDILNNNNIDEASKCLYSCITRSSESLYLLI